MGGFCPHSACNTHFLGAAHLRCSPGLSGGLGHHQSAAKLQVKVRCGEDGEMQEPKAKPPRFQSREKPRTGQKKKKNRAGESWKGPFHPKPVLFSRVENLVLLACV